LFQTPRVWGRFQQLELEYNVYLSDPTRVGRLYEQPSEVEQHVSDPTRVGKIAEIVSTVRGFSFRPHACGED